MTRAILIALLSFGITTTVCEWANGQQEAGEDASKEGFILQPGEGEVLLMGPPVGGKVIIKVDPAITGSPQMAMGIDFIERDSDSPA